MTMAICQVCGADVGRMHRAQERMFGLNGDFLYFECGRCGCLQLTNPPADLARYYAPGYQSFSAAAPPVTARGPLRQWLMRRRNAAQFFSERGFWGWLARLRPGPAPWNWSKLRLRDWHARLLDVGCGRGQFLDALAAAGFDNLMGVDPFLKYDERHGNAVRLYAADLKSLAEERFDAILFQHSLEHMADHRAVLQLAEQMLNHDGAVLVRMPLAGSAVWRQYGADWAELDAPRHLFVHTPGSFERILDDCSLKIDSVEYDMQSFGYWASELYRRGLTLYDPQTGRRREPADYFSQRELTELERRAHEDNRTGQAGRASFYLRRR